MHQGRRDHGRVDRASAARRTAIERLKCRRPQADARPKSANSRSSPFPPTPTPDLLVKSLAAPPRQERPQHATQTAAEHIQNIENKRAAHVARMADIMKAAADENRTLVEDEGRRNMTAWRVQVKSFDDDLGRWRGLEKLQITTATAVPAVTPAHRTYAHVSVRPNVEPGIKLARASSSRKMMARYEGATRPVCRAALERFHAGSRAGAQGGRRRRQHDRCDLGEAAGQSGDRGRLPAAAAGGDDPREDSRPAEGAVQRQRAGADGRRRRAAGSGKLKPKPVTALAFAMETLGVQQSRRRSSC